MLADLAGRGRRRGGGGDSFCVSGGGGGQGSRLSSGSKYKRKACLLTKLKSRKEAKGNKNSANPEIKRTILYEGRIEAVRLRSAKPPA